MPALSPQGGAAVTGTFRHGGGQSVSRRRCANEPAPALPATQGHGHARVHACNQHPGPRAGRRLHAEVLSAGRARRVPWLTHSPVPSHRWAASHARSCPSGSSNASEADLEQSGGRHVALSRPCGSRWPALLGPLPAGSGGSSESRPWPGRERGSAPTVLRERRGPFMHPRLNYNQEPLPNKAQVDTGNWQPAHKRLGSAAFP